MIIGIFGGSMASQWTQQGIGALTKELKTDPFFAGKELVFLNFALGGYKQPQQLMALNYIMAMGGEFDIVINLDGFNEVVLPVVENIPNKVFPFFPRAWRRRIGNKDLTDDELLAAAALLELKNKQRALQNKFASSPLRRSPTARLIMECLDRLLLSEISRARPEISRARNTDGRYEISGPPFQYKNGEAMYRDLANVWKNSSKLMHHICAANSIAYFHFLQPNQYVSDSKVFEKEELGIATRTNHPYKRSAETGYPYLVSAGKELTEEGVNFHDLTKVFKNDSFVYADSCCHINRKGNDILGQKIGAIINASFEKQ